MTDELTAAFEQLATRGRGAGAASVARRALEQFDESAAGPKRQRRYAFAALAATVAAIVGAVAVVQTRVSDIDRVAVGGALNEPPARADVLTVLAVGTDGRREVESERADAVMLLRLNRATGAASVLSVPRDVYLQGRQMRLAETFVDGPASVIEAVRSSIGVSVDHYVEFSFDGFVKIIDVVGGVRLQFPDAVRDELSGLDLPAGCNLLDGGEALAFVRSRHLVAESPTGPRVDPTGDLGRITRQQALLLAALRQLRGKLDEPLTVNRVTETLTKTVRVDERFSTGDMLRFAKGWAKHPERVRFLTIPVTHARTEQGAAVLNVDQGQLHSVLGSFTSDASGPTSAVPDSGCG